MYVVPCSPLEKKKMQWSVQKGGAAFVNTDKAIRVHQHKLHFPRALFNTLSQYIVKNMPLRSEETEGGGRGKNLPRKSRKNNMMCDRLKS